MRIGTVGMSLIFSKVELGLVAAILISSGCVRNPDSSDSGDGLLLCESNCAFAGYHLKRDSQILTVGDVSNAYIDCSDELHHCFSSAIIFSYPKNWKQDVYNWEVDGVTFNMNPTKYSSSICPGVENSKSYQIVAFPSEAKYGRSKFLYVVNERMGIVEFSESYCLSSDRPCEVSRTDTYLGCNDMNFMAPLRSGS